MGEGDRAIHTDEIHQHQGEHEQWPQENIPDYDVFCHVWFDHCFWLELTKFNLPLFADDKKILKLDMIAEGLQGFMTIDKTNTDNEENEPRIFD